MKKLVSVVVPMFNAESVIEGCLESIAWQSHSDVEVILVDNGSGDATVAKAQNVARALSLRVTLLSCRDRGPGFARNAGFLECKGDYIVWLDADDRMHENKLALQLEALAGVGAAPAIAACHVLVRRTLGGNDTFLLRLWNAVPEDSRVALHVHGALGAPPVAYLLTRAAGEQLHRTGGFLGVRCQDREYFARAALLKIFFVLVDEVLATYRVWSRDQVTQALDDLLWAPALGHLFEHLRSFEEPTHDERVRAVLRRRFDFLKWARFRVVNRRVERDGQPTFELDTLEWAVVRACWRVERIVYEEALVATTCRAFPSLAPSPWAVQDAVVRLRARGLLEGATLSDARRDALVRASAQVTA